jgi:type I restriction enzyme M protein
MLVGAQASYEWLEIEKGHQFMAHRRGKLRFEPVAPGRNISFFLKHLLCNLSDACIEGCMLTGELRSKIDNVWNAFWAGGIANPLEVIEQITYLLFMRGLDEAHTREENKANRLGKPMERRIFPKGKDKIGKGGGIAYEDMRWSRLKNISDPGKMFSTVSEHVFPFLRNMAEADTAHATHMKGARFTIPSPALLVKVVDLIDKLPMEDRDTKGDLYEYMLSKIATAGQNGQFRTPRHIIALMVEMMAPGPKDVICDPACGTCGFLVAAGEYLRNNHPKLFQEKGSRDHFHEEMFHGFDFDGTMLRIGSMNMTLHGVDNPDVRYKDSLAQEHAGDADRYSLVLANPPFAGSLDYETTAKDLLAIVKTKKTELLFMALFLKLLKAGGRAAVIVPDGVLFGSSTAHKEIRRMLVEDHRLDGIVKLPSGVFRPYAGVCPLRSCCSPRPIPAAPITSGSMIARPTVSRWMISAIRCYRWRRLDRGRNSAATNSQKTICPISPRAGRSAMALSASDRALRKVFAYPKPKSWQQVTTCRSTATRRLCTRRRSTAHRKKSSLS